MPRLILIASFFMIFFGACSGKEKQAESNLEKAKNYFAPLNDYRSLSCDVNLHLPESFKARKRAELKSSEELEVWNKIFDAVETKAFSWSTSMGRCWVRGMKNVKKQLNSSSQDLSKIQTKFLDNLHAQVTVGNCVLLHTFLYQSPLKGLKLHEYELASNPDGNGFFLDADHADSSIRWSADSKTLTSKSTNGESFMASYESEGEKLKLIRAGLKGATHKLNVEDIKYQSSVNERLIVDEYLLSLEENSRESKAGAFPQANVKFKNCVARIRPPSEEEKKTQEKADRHYKLK